MCLNVNARLLIIIVKGHIIVCYLLHNLKELVLTRLN